MYTCGHCKDPVPAFDKPRKGHLVVAQDSDGMIHTHGDLDKPDVMRDLVEAASAEVGAGLLKTGTVPKEIIFHNRQRIGDILMFTCGVRDFKKAFPDTRVNVISTAAHIWDHNPAIDRTLQPTEQNTLKIGPGWLTNASNRLDWHFANAYRISIEQALKVNIPQGESRPDLWLTEEEYHAPRVFAQPYWLIVVGGEKGWGCKMYPIAKWQEVIDQNPDLTFVQLGAAGDHPPKLAGPNVVDYVGKTEDRVTGIRQLYQLFLNAEGSIGLVSFHMHLSAGLYKPAVVVAGAREPVSFTRYQGHQYLSNEGCLPCASTTACWHCNIDACTNLVHYPDRIETKVPRCADMIEPEDITRAIDQYYKGGRLKKGVPSEKPKFKRIVPTPLKPLVAVATPFDGLASTEKAALETRHGLEFGGSQLTDRDWRFLRECLQEHHVTSSVSFRDNFAAKLLASTTTHRIGMGADVDLAFVDGPGNGTTREEPTKWASDHARVVVIHDANRELERKWQDTYLKGRFDGPIKGGHRCSLWVKAAVTATTTGKLIRIVSTARGWGGCARSVTTIMKLLLDRGHQVEFIPFRGSVTSKEFTECLQNGLKPVRVTGFDALKQPCDTLLVYADDYVWEFEKPEVGDRFANLSAGRKILMLNYRRGKVGELPWTRHWDRYCFLNSTQEKELLAVHPDVPTTVLPPCTDLAPFFAVPTRQDGAIHVVRHNSQGDTKFVKDDGKEILAALERPDLDIAMLPGPSFVPAQPRFHKAGRTADPQTIANFLSAGNLFWYSLPDGYMDMGPRVILEAMAAGLPVLADPWGGAVDRVTPDCGWLLPKDEQRKLLQTVTAEEVAEKGRNARQRAEDFKPERWVDLLVGNG